ncbi:MAG: DUF1015 family protein [Phycisphaerales bacterium]
MRIAAVATTRPPKARAVEVACAPDAPADLAAMPPASFARVLGGHAGTDAVRAELDRLATTGALAHDPEPRMFVYRAAHAGKRWMGVVCAVDTRDLATLLPHAASDAEISAARTDLERVGAQLVPALVRVERSDDVAYLMTCDTNERPAYHFVSADGSTHSAWTVHRPEAYVQAFAELDAAANDAGGIAARSAGASGAHATSTARAFGGRVVATAAIRIDAGV